MAKDYFKIIKEKKLRVVPTLDKKGRILKWQAGFITVDSRGWNYVANHQFSMASTAEEAIDKLLRGDTEYVRYRGGIKSNR